MDEVPLNFRFGVKLFLTGRLYRRNPTASQELRLDDPTGLGRSNYNSALPTKIFAHGFTMTGTDISILNMRDGTFQTCSMESVCLNNTSFCRDAQESGLQLYLR